MEEKINELTTEIVGAKELIGELQETDKRKNNESVQMREQVEEVAVLRMQVNVMFCSYTLSVPIMYTIHAMRTVSMLCYS